MNLHQKTVVITGAAAGLGLAMAERLNRLGANLVVTDIDAKRIEKAAETLSVDSGREVMGLAHDVSTVEGWQSVYECVSDRYGELHGLVNNAGIMLHKPFPQTTLDMFQKTQRVNVDSIFIGVQTFLPLLKRGGEGGESASVVNVSSMFGQVAGPMHSAYCASKGAVRLLTKSMAVELPKLGYNVRCNSIHPGVMDTGVSLTALQTLVDMGQFPTVEEAAAYFSTVIPLGRPGQGDEIAAGVAFLLSAESSLMTGSELTMDGGYTAL